LDDLEELVETVAVLAREDDQGLRASDDDAALWAAGHGDASPTPDLE
jgi:hypothetical protein